MCSGYSARGADEADARGEGAAEGLGEGEVLRRVDVVVDDVGIGAIGDVFDEAAKAEAKLTKAEKAPPPAPKKVAPTQIKKITQSSGKQHQEEINALGNGPIETG